VPEDDCKYSGLRGVASEQRIAKRLYGLTPVRPLKNCDVFVTWAFNQFTQSQIYQHQTSGAPYGSHPPCLKLILYPASMWAQKELESKTFGKPVPICTSGKTKGAVNRRYRQCRRRARRLGPTCLQNIHASLRQWEGNTESIAAHDKIGGYFATASGS